MSTKNQRAPVGSKTFAAAVAAASTSSSPPVSVSNATSVIIGVTASVGSVVLLVVAIRIWRSTRPPKVPLPPKGPLAHDRLRHEFTHSQLPVPIGAQAFVPLARHTPTSPYNHYSHHRSHSHTDVASIPPSSSSVVSSQAHLVPENDENAEKGRGRQPSFGSPSGTVRHHQGYRSRTISNTGSMRSTRSRQSSQTTRGPPHHRHINIVLPQPLAPELYNINTLRQPHIHFSRDNLGERRSESHDRGALSVTSPQSTCLDLRFGRVSMDGSSSFMHEPAPHIPLHHGPSAAYPPPAPLLRTEYPTFTPKPPVFHALPTDVSPLPSNPSLPLLRLSTASPDRGPPPRPPPKDFPPLRSSRPRRNSEAAGGRQRP